MKHVNSNGFQSFNLKDGLLHDLQDNTFPTRLHAWDLKQEFNNGSTYFGFVYSGPATLTTKHNEVVLKEGQYFCIHNQVEINGGSGIVVETLNYKGLDMIGGPVETSGRLRYVDGCTDSLLVPPVRQGDPCLNALFFPASTNQTQHTHPSFRLGMVVEGKGTCIVPEKNISLVPGMVFMIPENGLHRFVTDTYQGMTVVAYHPDSDYGPKDDNHPMINRTIVDGISASSLPDIQTRDL